MTSILETASPLLKIIIYGVFTIGLGFGLIGVWFVYLGSTGETEFQLLGQSFKSVNVGIGAVFIGGVIITLTLRRAFKTIEIGMNHAANQAGSQSKYSQQALSAKQLQLLQLIASNGKHGIYAGYLVKEDGIGLDRDEIVFRCRDLERSGYITIQGLTDLLYTATDKGLKEIT